MSYSTGRISLPPNARPNMVTTIDLPRWPTEEINPHVGFKGSVVEVNGDRTTALLGFDDFTEDPPISFGSSSSFMFTYAPTFASVAFDLWESGAMTSDVACSRTDTAAVPTCTVSLHGPGVRSIYCPSLPTRSVSTNTWTQPQPAFCTEGASAPDSVLQSTFTLDETQGREYMVFLTAGLEKVPSAPLMTVVPDGSLGVIEAKGGAVSLLRPGLVLMCVGLAVAVGLS